MYRELDNQRVYLFALLAHQQYTCATVIDDSPFNKVDGFFQYFFCHFIFGQLSASLSMYHLFYKTSQYLYPCQNLLHLDATLFATIISAFFVLIFFEHILQHDLFQLQNQLEFVFLFFVQARSEYPLFFLSSITCSPGCFLILWS